MTDNGQLTTDAGRRTLPSSLLVPFVFLVLFCGHFLAASAVAADAPAWWSNRNVIVSSATNNDYAPLLSGQLKWLATNAYDELEVKLPGGAGADLTATLQAWLPDNVNYSAVNVGQLKFIAAKFYDRLIATGHATAYPWGPSTNDFAPANIGQAKYLFNFELGDSVLATVSGTVSYTGSQTGTIYVVAVTSPNGWATNRSVSLSGPGSYAITNLPTLANYWIKAWRDSNGNGAYDNWEAAGLLSSFPVYLSTSLPNLNLTLADPDSDTDADGLPDSWELQIVNASLTDGIEKIEHVLPGDDFDGDGVSNRDECLAGTDPGDPASCPCLARFEIAEQTVYEPTNGNQTASVAVCLTRVPAQAVSVEVSVTDGTASGGLDYDFSNTVLVFGVGQTNKTVSVTIKSDQVREPEESIRMGLRTVSGPALVSPGAFHVIRIFNNATDLDGDGLPDWWEMLHFTNLLQGAGGDPDGDGISNLQEYQQGMNPKAKLTADTGNTLQLRVETPLR